MFNFGPYRTQNALHPLAMGLMNMGDRVLQSAREREEIERLEQQRTEDLTYRDQRDAVADQRYDAETARINEQDRRGQVDARRGEERGALLDGFAVKPIGPRTETGVATPDGYKGGSGKLKGYAQAAIDYGDYDPTRSVSFRANEAAATADAARGRDEMDYQHELNTKAAEHDLRLQKDLLEHKAATGVHQPPKLSVDQRKDMGFLGRAQSSLPVIEQYLEQRGGKAGGLSGLQRIPLVGGGVQALGQPQEDKVYNAAMSDLVGALLRKETGAAISEHEWDYADRVWVPLASDDPATVAQKMRNVRAAVQSLTVGMPTPSGDAPNVNFAPPPQSDAGPGFTPPPPRRSSYRPENPFASR